MELQIRGVSKTYPNGVRALKDVTLSIPSTSGATECMRASRSQPL
jgi:ABC-type phosphate/phosphonate transport system ATPase subunit